MSKLTVIDSNPRRVFAIGDIHGCPDELAVLLTHLAEREKIDEQDLVITIGDYIDRGPNSKGVIDLLIDFKRRFPTTINLRGNHEDMLLDFLGFGGNMGPSYLHNGARDTFGSYGISPLLPADEIAHLLPREHFSFYLNLESYVLVGDHVFVHAGLSPLRELEMQLDYDLFWIRDEFIQNIHAFKKTIVFGHTPYQDVLFHDQFKIGIDTGLVFGNALTCVEVVGRTILQVERESTTVRVRDFPKRA